MNWTWLARVGLLIGFMLSISACAGDKKELSSMPDRPLDATSGARLYVFHAGDNNVTVIDTETNEVVKAATIPEVKTWAWIDDTNYYDGQNLWTANMDPDTEEVSIDLLDLSSLKVTKSIPIGKEKGEAFISKASTNGQVFVSLLTSGKVVVIDAAEHKVVKRLSANKIACDVDIAVLPDGTERVFVPNREADTVQVIDASTQEIISTVPQPEGSSPWMLAVSPDSRHLWVQDQKSNTNSILDTITLETVKRIPTGNIPSMVAFSPDGSQAYTGHVRDSFVLVTDTNTFEELGRIHLGQNPIFVIFRPDGKYAYATVSRENSVAVIDTATRQVVKRIEVRRSPAGVYMLPAN